MSCVARCLLLQLVVSSCAYTRGGLKSSYSMEYFNQSLLQQLRKEIGPRHVSIIWVGDSTTRNQMHFMCDILTGREANGVCSRGGFSINKGAEFGGASPPWRMDTAVMDNFHVKNVSESSTVNVVYFGSTLLHAMHLLPRIPWRGEGIDMTRGLANVVRQIREARMCPVFHTINYVCDSAWSGELAAVVKNASVLRSAYFETACAEAVQTGSRSATEVALCANLSFTSWGSDHGASLELAATDAIDPPLDTINMHTMTKHQCWAAPDGKHYPPCFLRK